MGADRRRQDAAGPEITPGQNEVAALRPFPDQSGIPEINDEGGLEEGDLLKMWHGKMRVNTGRLVKRTLLGSEEIRGLRQGKGMSQQALAMPWMWE